MGLFTKKSSNVPDASINTEDEVLGYLDEIISQRKSFEVSISNITLKCNVYSIEEKKGLIQIEQKSEFDNYSGKSALCGFSIDKAWFVFHSKLSISNNKYFVEIPKFITYKERRQHKRTSFIAREAVSVSVLESLGSGTGVTGKALNICEGGLCASIIRVVNMDNEKEIRPHRELFTPDQKVMLVRVKNIPGVKEFDTEGKVNRVILNREWNIVVTFKGLPGSAKREIKQFIDSRTREFKLFKKSRKKRLEIEKRQKNVLDNQVNKVVQEAQPELKKRIVEEKSKTVEPFALISMGESIEKELLFLNKISHCQWIKCRNPLEMSKHLRSSSPSYLVLPYMLNNNNTLDYLKKLYAMDLLNKIKIIILNNQKIQVEDIAKCKLLGIKHLIELPLQDPQKLIQIFK